MKTHSTIVNAVFGSLVFLVMMFAPGEGWGQSYLGLDGGFEGSATIDNTNVQTAPQAGKWTKANVTQTIADETTIVRSGGHSLRINNSVTTNRRVWSPLITVSSQTTQVTIQYFRRVANATNSQKNQEGVVRSGTEDFQTTYDTPAANTWDKETYNPSSRTFTNIAGILMHSAIGSGGDMFIDDMCIYAGATDVSAPLSPGAVTVVQNSVNPTTKLDVSWGAASGGVDNGGYIVVRYGSAPEATDDPNQNGIYKVDNTITVSNTGTVAYYGTSLSFTDDNNGAGLTPGDTYYYKVYTYDKAYNYSGESSGNGSTASSGTTPPTLSAAADQTVDNNFNITFTDNPTWRAAVTGITVDGTSYLAASGVYSLTSGSLVLTTASIAELQTAGSHTIIVLATGYTNTSVTQTNIAGVATKLEMKTQPTSPASNGAVLATQPAVFIQDQYGNTTTSTADVIAAVGAGTWTLGGTTTVAAVAGTTTYSGLTASSAASVTGATIDFTSSGLTGVTSGAFNIVAPVITLSAAADQTVDNNFNITFTDDPTWRAAVTGITVDGTSYLAASGVYSLTSGSLVLTTASITELQTAGSHTIIVLATGYSNASVTQTNIAGVATKLGMKTQPTAPASNGAALAIQPAVYIQDQYGNTTTSTADVIAAVGAGTWTLGGTTTVAAVAGTTTYSGLTASSAATVTGATIDFTSSGLTGVTSAGFNIPVPLVNDLCINATSITIDAAAIGGTLTGATATAGNTFTYEPTKNDVWYVFTPTCTGDHTITVNFATGPDIDFDVFTSTCPTGGTAPVNAQSVDETSETVSASFTNGTTFYIRVIDYNTNAGVFTISITGPTPVTQTVTSSAATNITETTATLNGNVTVLGVCPSTTEKGFVYSATATNSDPLVAGEGVTKTSVSGIATGAFILDVASLTGATGYSFKSYVYDGSSYVYGTVTNFTTTIPAPVATSANVLSSTVFTANWNASTGADSYRLDVSTSETFGTGVNATDLFISEYIEGSSNNKYIEIFNGTGSAVDLSNYKLQVYSNGSATVSVEVTLSGTLNNGNTIVYKNSLATIYGGTTINSGAVIFNGDDAMALYKISTSSYVDIIGRIGEDPGSSWTSGSFSTVDKTLVRKSTITGGVTTNPASGFPTLSTDWDQYEIDVVTNLGSHTFNWPIPSYVTGYEDLTVNATSQTVSGLSPNTFYYYRVSAFSTNSTSANSNVITAGTGNHYESQVDGGSWNTTTTWNPNGTPSAIDDVTIKSTFPVIVDAANTTPATCASLTIETGTSLTIDPNKALTVNLGLSNVDGITGLIVKSDINGTGSLIHSTTDINGTFERYMNDADWTNWQDGWHFLSSPVATQAISTNFTTDPYDFYCWYEPTNVWVNYKNMSIGGGTAPFFDVVNGSANFTVGRGYLAEYDVAATKSFSGVLNVTDVAVTGLTITGSSQLNRSWHMLGNPFGSAITWDASSAWGLTNIGGVAQIWDEASQDYVALTSTPSSVIPATNGFMVQADGGTGSLTIPAAKRTHSAQPFYKSTIPGVKLTARNITAGNAKESAVYFNPEATKGFDLMFDGEFLHGYGPSFFSTSGGVKLSINSLPDLSAQTSIPFAFIPNEGASFKIEASGLESVFAQAWLLDKKTNTDHNLSLNPVYNFTASTGDNPDRFILHFSGVGMGETTIAETISVYNAGNTINISSKTGASLNGNVYVYNMIGQLIHSQTLSGGNLTKITLNTHTGYYLVKVVTPDHTISTKVFFN